MYWKFDRPRSKTKNYCWYWSFDPEKNQDELTKFSSIRQSWPQNGASYRYFQSDSPSPSPLGRSLWTYCSKKTYVNKVNRQKRLEYARHYREKSLGFWKNVVWSDESKFNLFGSDGKIIVWRSVKVEFEPPCTGPTVKYGGGNVKCWGCFSETGVGRLIFIDGNMTEEMYREILDQNLSESVKKRTYVKAGFFSMTTIPNMGQLSWRIGWIETVLSD